MRCCRLWRAALREASSLRARVTGATGVTTANCAAPKTRDTLGRASDGLYPIQLSISTGNKVSVNYQSQEVNVSVTYQLESEDTDLLSFARNKASEIAAVHGRASHF